MKPLFSPLVINLSLICQQHVVISAWMHTNVNRSYKKITVRGKIRSFLKLFVNGVKWSGSIPIVDFCKYVISRLLVVLKEQGLMCPTMRQGLMMLKEGKQ